MHYSYLLVLICFQPMHSPPTIERTVARNQNATGLTTMDHCYIPDGNLCPSWYFCNTTSGRCLAGPLPHDQITFDDAATKNVSVLDCCCITFDIATLSNEAGKCIYHCGSAHHGIDPVYRQSPSNVYELNDIACGKTFNRQGTLCGKCMDHHYPLAYSFSLSCKKCHDNRIWFSSLKYFIAAFIPLTLFFYVMLFFQISVLNSHLFGFVMYSQAVSFPVMCRIAYMAYKQSSGVYLGLGILGSIYGIWNLDFIRPFLEGFCVHTDTLLVSSLDLLVSIYPLMLIFITYVFVRLYDNKTKAVVFLLKPIIALHHFLKRKFDIRTSLVDAFATFLFLSNVKIYSVSFDILAPVEVHIMSATGNTSTEYRLFFDATVRYFGKKHLAYVLVSLAMLLLLVFIPGIVLALYPLRNFQSLLNRLPHQVLLLVHTYADIYYGSYKDGSTTNSNDCRWFASVFIFIRMFLFVLYGYTLNVMYFVLASFLLVLVCILVILVEPFKNNTRHNMLTVSFLLCLAGLYTSIFGADVAGLKERMLKRYFETFLVVFGATPTLYLVYVFIIWTCTQKFIRKWINDGE